MAEVDFPRGKYPGYKDSLAKKVPKRPAEDELFSTRIVADNDDDGTIDDKSKSSKKAKRQRNKKGQVSDEITVPGLPDFKEKLVIYRLKVTSVVINSIVLGCVTEIKDYEMSIQLPGAVMVRVSITNISEPYSKALIGYAKDPSNNPSPPKPKSLFTPGQLLPLKILDKKETNVQYEDASMSFIDIDASINPKDVYGDVHSVTFMKYCIHTSVSAAVVEVEDHGYLMDIGRDNVTGFLDFEDAKPFTEAHKMDKLHIGQVLLCTVISATSRVVKLTTKSINKTPYIEESSFPVSCLLPGVHVTAKILATYDKGLEVVIFGQHRGFVHRDHLKTIWDLPRDDYTVGNEVKGIVLFVNPINKVAALSLRSSTEMLALKNSCSELRVGQLISEAQIVGKDSGESLILRFPNGFKGFAPKSELSDNYLGSEDFAIIENQMPIGSIQKCRIKSFSYLDGYAKVTLKPSLLEAEYLSVDKLKIGQVIEGRVKKLTKKGLVINLGFALKAICPPIHHKDSAKPKDYKAGSKVKCRIIRLDRQSLLPRIAVTCRKEIIRESNIIDDISKAKPGTFTRGVIVLVQDNGLLLEFFNELRGWLSASWLAKEGQPYSASSYDVGQILPVYITGCKHEEKKIYVSLTYSEPEEEIEKSLNTSSTPLGTILTNLTVSGKDGNGFILTNEQMDKYYLPRYQLSDFPDMNEKIYECIQEEETIDKVAVFNNLTDIPTVTRRGIFIRASEQDSPVFKPETLNTDLVIPAIVRNFKTYGIIVECPGGLIGLIPTEHISKDKVDPLNCGFSLNQTILVHINHVKEQEGKGKRLNCSSVLSQCASPDFTSTTILAHYLSDHAFVKSKLYHIENNSVIRTLSTIKLGAILPFKVVDCIGRQALVACTVDGCKKPIPGVITHQNIKSKEFGKIGHTGEAVVLYIDIEKKCIHLSADPDLRKKASSAIKASSYTTVTPGQILISLVELVSEKFYIISLKGHGIGALAYIPRYFHLNALKPKSNLFKTGQKLYFAIKDKLQAADGSVIIVGSKTLEKPNAVKNAQAKALLAKANKETIKKLMEMTKEKIKCHKEQEKKEKVVESKKVDDDEKENDQDEGEEEEEEEEEIDDYDPDEINFDSEEEEEEEDKEGNEDDERNGELKSLKSADEQLNDADVIRQDLNASFFVDTEGNLQKTRKSRNNSANSDDVSSVEDSDNDSEEDVTIKTPKDVTLKKRKRKLSENKPEDELKERKKKHFKKLQALVSDRIKSAVTDEDEVFFWDITGDQKALDKEIIVEEEATINVPIRREDNDESGPLTKEEFEKLIVQSPNDIDRWFRYINYYLGQAEITKAKELCERALETIDHTIEDGKLRIWTLKLKIEYKHGSSESLDELIKKALCANDDLKVYKNLINIYEEDGKTELAEQTFKEATKKFPLNKSLWVDFGRYYLKHNRVNSFRDLFHRCINYMEKKEQLDLIIKFAQLECQLGDLERAKTMFEAALVNFPKRTDIWSIYIDMMIKYGLKKEEGIIKRDSIESIRLLFERATAIKIKEKKIRFLFQKYIDFEKQYGDEERIANINRKISEYVEANDIVI